MAKVQAFPPAELDSRERDIDLPIPVLFKFGLFAQLKSKPTLDKFPGTWKVRSYRPDDILCRQGDAGWTCYYILSLEDVLVMRRYQLEAMPEGHPQRKELQDVLEKEEAKIRAPDAQRPWKMARVYQELSQAGPQRLPWPLRTLYRWFFPHRAGSVDAAAKSGSETDGKSPASDSKPAEERGAPLFEGQLVGEMACLYNSPRSGTIVATRKLYAVEMLRNILTLLRKDKVFADKMDKLVEERLFESQLRQLPILAELPLDQYKAVRDKLKLVKFDPGQIIYDEFEPADGLYVILRGLVRVGKKTSAILTHKFIRSWKAFSMALRDGANQKGKPEGRVWELLDEPTRAACLAVAGDGSEADKGHRTILNQLNKLIKDRKFKDYPEFQPLCRSEAFLTKADGYPNDPKTWSEQDARRYNRQILEAIYFGKIREHQRRVGPEIILFYFSRGEFFGEGALFDAQHRGVTCIAYGHPLATGDEAQIQLVYIPQDVAVQLLQTAPQLRGQLEAVHNQRTQHIKKVEAIPPFEDDRPVLSSDKFGQLGLIQGQRLMLIDLDRCTRCDECVRACVGTHDDGRSRLFLDGPRFGKFLVPISCRSCLDPVCTDGCPVGSIHPGKNGQIVIENWCIGCGKCAKQCPYGSIQMHDIGIIGETARGWRLMPAAAVVEAPWTRAKFDDRRWEEGTGPFANNLGFRLQVSRRIPQEAKRKIEALLAGPESPVQLPEYIAKNSALLTTSMGEAVCFRFEFELDRDAVVPGIQYRMEVTSADPNALVWLNGQELKTAEAAKKGMRQFWVPEKVAAPDGQPPAKAAVLVPPHPLQAGRNVVAVKVEPVAPDGEIVLKLRLDQVIKPTVLSDDPQDEVTQKQVTERAVVCDLCSSSLGQVPACVNACPHDAAMRIDARADFPVG